MPTELMNELTAVVVDDDESIREGCKQTLFVAGIYYLVYLRGRTREPDG
jgi:FixJ family two-component response regulator